MNENTLIYRMAFASVRGMGVDLAGKLLDVVGSEEAFFAMSERELQALTGGHNKLCQRAYRNERLEAARRELDFVMNNHVNVLYFTDDNYPTRLLHDAADAPILLYTTGTCNLNTTHVVSIVGTRKATHYGKQFVDTFVGGLAEQLDDLVIVSGLAYGTDINAHRAALAHGVPTVGVQARGLNKIYPGAHRRDAGEMVHRGGMVVSDYQSQDEIHRGNFLARNRIIAALSDCTVIVESADTGGSLVTASLAASYNRDVFAVPGRVTDLYSQGCNKLIKANRAAAITGADDLIKEMRWEPRKKTVAQPTQREIFPQLEPDEQRVIDLLRTQGELHINDIAGLMALPIYRCLALLVSLDTRGLIHTLPGARYSL